MISLGDLDWAAVTCGERPVTAISLGEVDLWSSGPRAITQITQVKPALGATGTTSSFSGTVNFDDGVAGDLYMLVIGCDGSRNITVSADGWQRLAGHASDPSFVVYIGYHGTATSPVTISFGAIESYVVTQWHFRGTTLDPLQIGVSPVTTGSSTAPNLPLFTPPLGADVPYLWFQAFGMAGRTLTSGGADWEYASWAQGTTATSGAAGGAYRIVKAAEMDPPAATLSASTPWAGLMLAIPPQLQGLPPEPAPMTLRMERSSDAPATPLPTSSSRIMDFIASILYPKTQVTDLGDLIALFSGPVVATAKATVAAGSTAFGTDINVELWHNGTRLELKTERLSFGASAEITFSHNLQVYRGDRVYMTAYASASTAVLSAGSVTFVQIDPAA